MNNHSSSVGPDTETAAGNADGYQTGTEAGAAVGIPPPAEGESPAQGAAPPQPRPGSNRARTPAGRRREPRTAAPLTPRAATGAQRPPPAGQGRGAAGGALSAVGAGAPRHRRRWGPGAAAAPAPPPPSQPGPAGLSAPSRPASAGARRLPLA